MHRVQDRTGLAGRPHCKAVNAQIADTQAEAARLGTIAARECRKSRRARAREQIGQRGVLLAVRYRVQAEYGCLRHRIDLGRVQTQPSPAGGVGRIDCHPACSFLVALGQGRIGAPLHVPQAHEV